MPDIRKIPGMTQWRDYDPSEFFDGLDAAAKQDPAIPDALRNKVADLVATYTGDNATLIAGQIVLLLSAHFKVDADE